MPMTYIYIVNQVWAGDHWEDDANPDLYQVDTPEQIAEAQQALRDHDLTSAKIYSSPWASVDELEAYDQASCDDVDTGSVLFAE
jgi:hypothetical protein